MQCGVLRVVQLRTSRISGTAATPQRQQLGHEGGLVADAVAYSSNREARNLARAEGHPAGARLATVTTAGGSARL